jgi:hypothetical protein
MENPDHITASKFKLETKEQLRLQIAQYMEQLPQSKRAFHKGMKLLEGVGVVIIVAAFSFAMYISIAWKSVNPFIIPIAWFAFAASASPLLVLTGLHAVILKAFPPITWLGKTQKFITGSGAVRSGWGSISVSILLVAFWGFFAYATWTQNWALLTPLIGIMGAAMGGMIVIAMLLTTIQKLTRFR